MDLFTALADPTRRDILESLAGGDRSFSDIAAAFPMSRPAVSQHLKVLKRTGLVSVRADAQRRIYSLETDGLDVVDAWLTRVREFWNRRLDQLEHELQKDHQDE